jgi:hypothetical protein
MSQGDYLLLNSASELERLRIQARVWEPETEAWLDASARWKAGIASIWVAGHGHPWSSCTARWTSGSIVGVDIDPMQLRGACALHVCVFNGSSLHLSTTLRRRYGTARPVRPCEPADRTFRRHLR